jgi:hypothetical protein
MLFWGGLWRRGAGKAREKVKGKKGKGKREE